MNHFLLFQFKMARDWCIEVAESCPRELSEVQSDMFNNTIQWQVGHILTVTERMLFQATDFSSSLPRSFSEWFEAGTRPSEWTERPPGVAELVVRLKEQQARILDLAPDRFDQRLNKPFYGFTRYGECAAFATIHETLHIGKMEEMLRALSYRSE